MQVDEPMSVSEILTHTDHRPWAPPRGPWIMTQIWHELLFAHWPVKPSALAARIPPGLTLDTLDGQAWISVVPFRMSGIRPRGAPTVPTLSQFPEINLRTYVVAEDKPGVWFFSLDAGNPVAVALARSLFHLPYYNARFTFARLGDVVAYTNHRTHRHAPPADFAATYGPTGPSYHARPGTLEHWLTERYCLYTTGRRGRLARCEIHHPQWTLQPAEATFSQQTLTTAAGIALPDTRPMLQYAHRLQIVAWPLHVVGA
jgi:uncharacterized protein YqjF (DUF2071 family)